MLFLFIYLFIIIILQLLSLLSFPRMRRIVTLSRIDRNPNDGYVILATRKNYLRIYLATFYLLYIRHSNNLEHSKQHICLHVIKAMEFLTPVL